jgi:hypothetical protein
VGNFYTTTITYNALVSDGLEFSTKTFPLFGSTKDSFAEKTIFLWPESTVIYSLRLFYLAI